MGEEIITGMVERVAFHHEETGFVILKVQTTQRHEPVTVKGTTSVVQPGEKISATGHWVNDAAYGRQFVAQTLRTEAPASIEGMQRFLGSGLIDGIGPVYAEKMVKKFGERIFDIIDKESGRLEEIDGIGTKRRREIKVSWEKHKAVREIMVFLHQHGLSSARATRIYQQYGEHAVSTITHNPYQLAEDIWGIGFKTADAVATSLGLPPEGEMRLRAGIFFTLQQAGQDGHCALPVEELLRRASTILSDRAALDDAVLMEMITRLISHGELVVSEFHDERLIFLPPMERAEREIAERLQQLIARPVGYPEVDQTKALQWVERETGKSLAESQQQALLAALKARVIVITGGPGVGKTTILNALIKILAAKGVRIELGAPTGRAAKRMAESTGREAKTIHRLLEYQPGKGWARDEKRPLEGDLFIIDESSMLDVMLMWQVLRALPEEAHLVLVGDVDQLPSVGAGSVLRDVIESGLVPVARLTEIFRQARTSRIVTAAHAVNVGQLPELAAEGEKSDYYFIERENPEAIHDTLRHVIKERLPAKFHIDPMREIQVLTPMNRGLLGTQALNQSIQSLLNPPSEWKPEVERFGQIFRQGDKVIQLRNNYDKEVFNGDIGTILQIDSEPVRIVVVFDHQRQVIYEPAELDELRLAYVITIHKSQGSEFPVVIIPLSTQHFLMLQRNLLYTGVTRGKKLVIVIGEKKALEIAVSRADSKRRFSHLCSRLKQK